MSVSVAPGAAFLPSSPRTLFPDSYAEPQESVHYYFDISPDGRRFVMVKNADRTRAVVQLHVVVNWLDELKSKGK